MKRNRPLLAMPQCLSLTRKTLTCHGLRRADEHHERLGVLQPHKQTMMNLDPHFIAKFVREIGHHTMQIIHDDGGVNRHIRFRRPDSMLMHFDLITWPGHLCYTGDMGTYVFKRLEDMFEFFRLAPGKAPHRMDLRYWAEKLVAVDAQDLAKEWSAQTFCDEVRDHFEQFTSDPEDWPPHRKEALWRQIDDQVCYAARTFDEHRAFESLQMFNVDGFRFEDWDRDCKNWTHRFLWCCNALEWAIATYDAHRDSSHDKAPDRQIAVRAG